MRISLRGGAGERQVEGRAGAYAHELAFEREATAARVSLLQGGRPMLQSPPKSSWARAGTAIALRELHGLAWHVPLQALKLACRRDTTFLDAFDREELARLLVLCKLHFAKRANPKCLLQRVIANARRRRAFRDGCRAVAGDRSRCDLEHYRLLRRLRLRLQAAPAVTVACGVLSSQVLAWLPVRILGGGVLLATEAPCEPLRHRRPAKHTDLPRSRSCPPWRPLRLAREAGKS